MIPLYRKARSFGDLKNRENIRRVLQEMYRINAEFLDTDLKGIRFNIEELAQVFLDEGYDSIPAVISALFSRNAAGEGKVRWLDKTPYYILHLPAVMEMFPDAQIIHIIRDGRDCALSMMERAHDLHVYNVYHAAKYWEQYVETGREWGRTAGDGIYCELRYEDLLAKPTDSLHKVCCFLKEEYSDSLVNFQKSADPKTKTPLLRKEIQKDNTEKWRQKMTPWQIRVFESAAGSTLEKVGYRLCTTPNRLPLLVRGLYRMHSRSMSTFWRWRLNKEVR